MALWVWVAAWAKLCSAVWHSGVDVCIGKDKVKKKQKKQINKKDTKKKKKQNRENNILIDGEKKY